MTPFVPEFTPQELERGKEWMKTNTPESIDKAYRMGLITLKDKVLALRAYGQLDREIAVRGEQARAAEKSSAVSALGGGATGEVKYWFQNTVKEFQHSWDSAQEGKKAQSVLYGLMGALEGMKVYDIPGNIVERWALDAGVSPGLARAANWAVWIPTNFVGVSSLLKLPFKAGGAAVRGVRAGKAAVGKELRETLDWVADPVGMATRQAREIDAKTAVEATKSALSPQSSAFSTGVSQAVKAVGEAEIHHPLEPVQIRKPQDILTEMENRLTQESVQQHLRTGASEREALDLAKDPAAFHSRKDFAKLLAYEFAQGKGDPKKAVETIINAGNLKELTLEEKAAITQYLDRNPAEIGMRGEKTQLDRLLEPDQLKAVRDWYKGVLPEPSLKLPPGVKIGSFETAFEVPEDFERKSIQGLLDFYDKRAAAFARKGTTHEMTQAEAAAKPLNFEEIISREPGEKMSAAELERLSRVHEQVSKGFDGIVDQITKNAEAVGAGQMPDLAASFKAHLQALELTNPAFLGAVGEAGRALEYTKTMQGLIGQSRLVDGVLKGLSSDAISSGSDQVVADAARRLAMLTEEGRDTFLKEAAKNYKPGILHSLFKTLLFTSPSTHVVNLLGGQTTVGGKLIDKTMQTFVPFSGGAGPSLAETKALWAGYFSSLLNVPRVWRQAVERSATQTEKFGLEGAEDVLAKYGTGRILQMEDEFTSAPLESALVQAAATRMGLEKKLQGDALKSFVNDILGDAKKVAELSEQVAPEVGETMLHSPLSQWGEQGARFIRNSPFDFWLPIVKFPINSLKAARDWTPGLQVLSKRFADELAEGGQKEVAARTRATLSWMFANMIWTGTKSGYFTGGGPQDDRLRKEWLAAGNVPYAVNGVPVRWAEPFGTVFAAVTDMASVSNQMDPGDVEDFAGGVSTVLGRAVESHWLLRVLDGLTSVVTDVKNAAKFEDTMRAATKFVTNPLVTATGVGSPIALRVREQLDPEVKDIRTLADFYISKMPGYSKEVPPLLDYSGNARVIPPVMGQRWLSFFGPPIRTPQGVDTVAQFLDKNEITVNDDWKSYGGSADPDKPLETPSGQAPIGVHLSAEESHDWKKLALQNARRVFNDKTWVESIAELDADPNFAVLPRYKKQEKVSFLWSRYRDMGFKMLKQLNSDVAARDEMAKQLTRESRGKVPFTNEPDELEETAPPVVQRLPEPSAPLVETTP